MKRSKHTLSNYRLSTFDMGQLIPVGLQEALPGDTFQLSSSALIRVSPLAAPVMHPVTVRIHHFFVPHRLSWAFADDESGTTGWENFITGGPDGEDTSTVPLLNPVMGTGLDKSLYDYLGLPTVAPATPGDTYGVSALPLAGINLIWNEYYRDQDLIPVPRTFGDPSVPQIGWGKDYFTTARPWTQKGPEVTLPLGTQAPVLGIGKPGAGAYDFNLTNVSVRESSGELVTYDFAGQAASTSPAQALVVRSPAAGTGATAFPDVYADLSAAGAININDFRRAFALQRYQEARARYGSRYTEYLRYLGVTPSDARLQRPEYLGGGTARINFSEVLQTAEDSAISPRTSFGVGDLYGHGVAGLRHGRIRRFIEEHGYIHSFISIRPKGIYTNGIPRTFLRRTKEDFWQRELQHIGQQEVYANELYPVDFDVDDPVTVFGYQDRYQEYRETPSQVTGEFRELLNYWHMARELDETVALNEAFVECVPTKRIHNVQTNSAIWAMINNHVVARRLVSRSASGRIL